MTTRRNVVEPPILRPMTANAAPAPAPTVCNVPSCSCSTVNSFFMQAPTRIDADRIIGGSIATGTLRLVPPLQPEAPLTVKQAAKAYRKAVKAAAAADERVGHARAALRLDQAAHGAAMNEVDKAKKALDAAALR